MRNITLFFFVVFGLLASSVAAQTSAPAAVHSGWEAFTELTKGNDRYLRGKSEFLKSWTAAQRSKLVGKRYPKAVVVTCSDSRINPDIVFDQPPGDLYIIRTAGMALDGASRGSIELALQRFKVPLVVFLMSEHCLALHEAPTITSHPDTIDMNHMFLFLKQHGISQAKTPAAVQMIVQQHMRAVVEQFIESSRLVQKLVATKKILLAEARLDFVSGKTYFRKVGAPQLKGNNLSWEREE